MEEFRIVRVTIPHGNTVFVLENGTYADYFELVDILLAPHHQRFTIKDFFHGDRLDPEIYGIIHDETDSDAWLETFEKLWAMSH